MRPSAVWAAYTPPCSMKMRQSAGSWFHRASATSALKSSSSDGVSDDLTANWRSEVAIARIVVSVLAEARQPAGGAVRGPIDQGQQRHARITEQSRRLGGVDQPALGGFDAGENRWLAQALPERFSKPAHAHGLRAADIERARRHGAMTQRAQHNGIGIALPDDVDMARGEVDRLACEDARGDVVQHAVAHVDRIVEADDAPRRSPCAREISEHAFARDAGI